MAKVIVIKGRKLPNKKERPSNDDSDDGGLVTTSTVVELAPGARKTHITKRTRRNRVCTNKRIY